MSEIVSQKERLAVPEEDVKEALNQGMFDVMKEAVGEEQRYVEDASYGALAKLFCPDLDEGAQKKLVLALFGRAPAAPGPVEDGRYQKHEYTEKEVKSFFSKLTSFRNSRQKNRFAPAFPSIPETFEELKSQTENRLYVDFYRAAVNSAARMIICNEEFLENAYPETQYDIMDSIIEAIKTLVASSDKAEAREDKSSGEESYDPNNQCGRGFTLVQKDPERPGGERLNQTVSASTILEYCSKEDEEIEGGVNQKDPLSLVIETLRSQITDTGNPRNIFNYSPGDDDGEGLPVEEFDERQVRIA